MTDGEDKSKVVFVVRVQSATRSYKKNRNGSITKNKDKWFKQEKDHRIRRKGAICTDGKFFC